MNSDSEYQYVRWNRLNETPIHTNTPTPKVNIAYSV
jgi:hypothetical protein